MRVFIFSLISTVIFLQACANNKQDENSIIYNEVLYSVLDSLNTNNELDGVTLYIGRHESDDVLQFISENVKSQFENETSGVGKIVVGLMDSLKIEIELNIFERDKPYKIVSGRTTFKPELSNKITRSQMSKEAILNCSEVVVDYQANMGVLYFSLQWGSPYGYLVFIEKSEGNWNFLQMIKVWG